MCVEMLLEVSYLSSCSYFHLIPSCLVFPPFSLPQPEWVLFLGQEAEDSLTALGSKWAARVGVGEVWAWVGVVGGSTLAEAVTTRELQQYPAATLMLDVFVAKTQRPGR